MAAAWKARSPTTIPASASCWWAPKTPPNIVEQARGRLDFLARYVFDLFGRPMELEFKARNLLDDDVLWRQGGLLYERYDPGVSYSLSLKASTN